MEKENLKNDEKMAKSLKLETFSHMNHDMRQIQAQIDILGEGLSMMEFRLKSIKTMISGLYDDCLKNPEDFDE